MIQDQAASSTGLKAIHVTIYALRLSLHHHLLIFAYNLFARVRSSHSRWTPKVLVGTRRKVVGF